MVNLSVFMSSRAKYCFVLLTIGRIKRDSGRAPSREKAQVWREAATKMDKPIMYWTMKTRAMNPSAPCLPNASKYICAKGWPNFEPRTFSIFGSMHAAKTMTMNQPNPPIVCCQCQDLKALVIPGLYLQHMPMEAKMPKGTALAAFNASSDIWTCKNRELGALYAYIQSLT